jgi:Putative peptidoglycan binding domain/Trypsin-like peptidase domain
LPPRSLMSLLWRERLINVKRIFAIGNRLIVWRRITWILRPSRSTGGTISLGIALAVGLDLSVGAALGAIQRLPAERGHRVFHAVAVFGSDDRVPVPRSLHEVTSKIGVFFNSRTHAVCTAFCVGPDIIVTAAHCLFRTSGQQPPNLADFTFRPDDEHTGTYIATTKEGALEPNVLAGSTHINVRPPIDTTRDWALVRLARSSCKTGGLKIGQRTVPEIMQLASAGKIFNVAYHRDVSNPHPMLARGCDVKRGFQGIDWPTIAADFADAERLLLHTCDTGPASSGSPLLIDDPNGPQVIGINIGTYERTKVVTVNDKVRHRLESNHVANTGVSAEAFATALAAFATGEMLSRANDIRLLQERLVARGLFKGRPDGKRGDELKDAIKSFERASAMPVTGLATHHLLQVLAGESDVVTGKTLPQQTSGAADHRAR